MSEYEEMAKEIFYHILEDGKPLMEIDYWEFKNEDKLRKWIEDYLEWQIQLMIDVALEEVEE